MTEAIRITGLIHEDAVLGYVPGIKTLAVLSFEIHPERGMPYRIRQRLGDDPNKHLTASAKLAVLRRGCEVAVYGSGLRLQSDHGIAALMVLDVTDVHPLSLPKHPREQEPTNRNPLKDE